MDLLSATIHLRARHNAHNVYYLGYKVQGWFMEVIKHFAPQLPNELHEKPEKIPHKDVLRPYTLSTVMKGERQLLDVTKGEWCSIRVTSLTPELSKMLRESVLPNLDKIPEMPTATIGPIDFDVEPLKEGAEEQGQIQTDSYENLKRRASEESSTQMLFGFDSPVSFLEMNKNPKIKKDYPLPAPDRVFGNYYKYWMTFSPSKINGEYGEFIEECLAVSKLKIRSEKVWIQREINRADIGFTGEVLYSILGDIKKSRLGNMWNYYAEVTRMLAQYSFYCGTGNDTTVGMGQTRLLPAKR